MYKAVNKERDMFVRCCRTSMSDCTPYAYTLLDRFSENLLTYHWEYDDTFNALLACKNSQELSEMFVQLRYEGRETLQSLDKKMAYVFPRYKYAPLATPYDRVEKYLLNYVFLEDMQV